MALCTDSNLSIPVHAFWEVQYRLTATCLDSNLVILVPGGINCALDFIILFMVRSLKGEANVKVIHTV